ncbi:hypothetical protein KKB18_11005 [bacterium]|nr:hypothetical protein [bacterium]
MNEKMSTDVYNLDKSSWFWIILSLFIIFYCFWITYLTILPFNDIPYNLAAATIYRYYDSTPDFSHFFTVKLFPIPNIFHLLFLRIPLFPTIEIANKFYYLLYMIMFPISILLIIRKLNGDYWFVLLSFLLIYNLDLKWGFVGFTFSIPVILFLIYFLICYYEKPSLKYRITIMLLLLFTFFIHVFSALFALLICFFTSLINHKCSVRKMIDEVMLAFPLLFMLFLWWIMREKGNQSILSFLVDYYKNEYLSTFLKRGAILFYDNYFLYGGILGYTIGTIFSLCIVIPFLVLVFRNVSKIKEDIFGKINIPFVFLFCSLGCTLLLPSGISHLKYWFWYHRFSVFLFISMIILGSIYSSRKSSLIKILILVTICMVHLVMWSDYFIDFKTENRDFTPEFFPEGGNGKVLAGMMFDCKFRGRYMYDHFIDYFIVWKRGISTSEMITYDFFPVKRKVDKELLPIHFDPENDKYNGQFSNLDYILVRGEIPKDISIQLNGFKQLKSSGKWALYGKNHDPINPND